jgi:hypothetical protein
MESVAQTPGSRAYWGPRLWKLFHTMAEYSDRRDVLQIWCNWVRVTAATMPCARCRTHLSAYLRSTVFMKSINIDRTTGEQMRHQVRTELHRLHNSVNARIGAPQVDIADLPTIYGAKGRDEALLESQRLFREIKAAWAPLIHLRISPAALTQWEQLGNMLLALLASGPAI